MVVVLHNDLTESEVFSRLCAQNVAWDTIDKFVKHFVVLEKEAQDLQELQSLLDVTIVNFALLKE
jgi:hypothetical protein